MIPKRERPIGITLLALAFLWIGCVGSICFVIMVSAVGRASVSTLIPPISQVSLSPVVGYSLLVLWFLAYVAYTFIGVGLWRLRNWARRSLHGLSIILGAIGFLLTLIFARPAVLGIPMIIGICVPFVWLTWYLARPRVVYAFGGESSQQTDLSSKLPSGMSAAGKIWTAIAGVTTFGLFIVALLFAVEIMMRQSDVYKMSLAQAQHSSCVAAVVGKSFTVGWFVSGSIEENNDDGSANFSIPIKGSMGSARLEVSAERHNKAWIIDELSLAQNEKMIRLIPSEASSTCQ